MPRTDRGLRGPGHRRNAARRNAWQRDAARRYAARRDAARRDAATRRYAARRPPPTAASPAATPPAGGISPGQEASAAVRPAGFPLSGLLALATAAFAAVVTEQLPAGLLAPMTGTLHVSEERIGFLVSGYAAAALLTAIPVTAALRGLPRRPVLIGALAGFMLCNAVTTVSADYRLTFAARLLAGAMGGTLWAMLAGYAARMVPAGRRGRAIAIVLAGITVALSAGIPAGTAVAAAAGWRTSFAALTVLTVILIGWTIRKVPGFPGEPAAGRMSLRRIAGLPGIRAVLVSTLLLLLGHQLMYTYLAPFAGRAGFGDIGLVLLAFGGATVAGIWVVGAVIDRRPRLALLSALALIAAVMLALGLAGRDPVVLLTAAGLWGAAFGGVPTLLQTALVRILRPGQRGRGHRDAGHRLQHRHRRRVAGRRHRAGRHWPRRPAVGRAWPGRCRAGDRGHGASPGVPGRSRRAGSGRTTSQRPLPGAEPGQGPGPLDHACHDRRRPAQSRSK